MKEHTPCPAPDVPAVPDNSPSGPRSAASTGSPALPSSTHSDSLNELILTQLQAAKALLAAAGAMAHLSQSIQALIEYGTRDNDEESDFPTVDLSGKPIIRS